MAAPLNTCTTIEQRGVVRFLWAKNMEAKVIHKEMLPIWAVFVTKTTKEERNKETKNHNLIPEFTMIRYLYHTSAWEQVIIFLIILSILREHRATTSFSSVHDSLPPA
jgi:hypothetical protein